MSDLLPAFELRAIEERAKERHGQAHENQDDYLEETADDVLRLLASHRALERQLAEAREPIKDTYACQRCGRRDGLDAVVNDEVWQRLSNAANGANLLCLWCMDALAARLAIKCAVSLHFAGTALYGTSQSEAERTARQQAEQRIGEIETELSRYKKDTNS